VYHGFAGKTLFVDLTNRSIDTEPIDIKDEEKFLGGFGTTYRLAYKLSKPGTDALAPGNPLVFGAGTLTGTTVPGAIKISAVTKLPLTGTFGWSHGSLGFASMLKFAGYDHLVVTGKADSPVYIKIINDSVEICDAGHLWGKDTIDATAEIKKDLAQSSVLCIGQAGENLVKLSLSLIDNMSSLGQGGLGAVMGSKNLKAVSVYGTKGIRISDKKRFSKAINGLKKRYMNFKHRDVVVDLGMMAAWKQLCTGYFSNEFMTPEEITDIYGIEQYKKVKLKGIACPGCLVGDKEIIEIKDGKFGTKFIPTTSYTEIPAFGTAFAIRDLSEGAYLFDLCNRFGISAQTLEGFLSFVLKLYEEGILKKGDMDGLELKRDFESVKSLIEMIVNRQGIGDILADGWSAVISKFGKGCEKHEFVTKNINFIWDPRIGTLGTMEFAQIVSPKGPYSAFGGSPTTIPDLDIDFFRRHCKRVGASDDQIQRILDSDLCLNIGRLTSCFENWVSLLSCLGICNRASNDRYYSAALCAELYSAATGIEMTESAMVKGAERSWMVTRAINLREGFSRKDDIIPEQWFHPLKTIDGKEHIMRDYYKKKVLDREDLNQWLDDYYDERGWEIETGIPKKEKLMALDLDDIAEDMEEFR